MYGISPKIPLLVDAIDGHYGLNKTIHQAVQQNLKNLILTQKGERIMDSNFGVGLRNFLFENITEEVKIDIQNEIIDTIKTFLPFVNIIQLNVTENNRNTINVTCKFSFNNNPNIFETIDFTIGE